MLLRLEGQSIGKALFTERRISIVLDDKVLNMCILAVVTGLYCVVIFAGWLAPHALSQDGKPNQTVECVEIYHSLRTFFFFSLNLV